MNNLYKKCLEYIEYISNHYNSQNYNFLFDSGEFYLEKRGKFWDQKTTTWSKRKIPLYNLYVEYKDWTDLQYFEGIDIILQERYEQIN